MVVKIHCWGSQEILIVILNNYIENLAEWMHFIFNTRTYTHPYLILCTKAFDSETFGNIRPHIKGFTQCLIACWLPTKTSVLQSVKLQSFKVKLHKTATQLIVMLLYQWFCDVSKVLSGLFKEVVLSLKSHASVIAGVTTGENKMFMIWIKRNSKFQQPSSLRTKPQNINWTFHKRHHDK